ncbi:MAG: M1 family metallopeptidase, partial [Chitinophagaceae bacterium]|nr:M1 family metallopeptidase [Chitinophagaceae bacterium]
HFQVVANGIQTEVTSLPNKMKLTRYTEMVPLPTKVMVIGVADFAVQLAGTVNCIPVYSWVYPENKDKGFYDYAQAASILPFFINNVGPYGYQKLANVQSKTRFGGLENASTIFYYENSVTGTRKSESLLAHEIAHQWFGNMATEKEWAHIWLSEGFATYMTILYMEKTYGKDTADKMLIDDRKQVVAFTQRKTAVVDSSATNYMDLLNANSYQKGGWVLHMLRKQLTDSVFWRGVRTYYQRYAGKNASTEDFQKVMEQVSGATLSQFFKQWLYTAGQPSLDIVQQYDAAKKVLTLTITQLQDVGFEFPLQIQLTGGADDGVITKSLPVKNKITTIGIPMMEKPVKLVLDPNVHLLFEAKVR